MAIPGSYGDTLSLLLMKMYDLPLTAQQQTRLNDWCDKHPYHKDLPQQVQDPRWIAKILAENSVEKQERHFQSVMDRINKG